MQIDRQTDIQRERENEEIQSVFEHPFFCTDHFPAAAFIIPSMSS